MPQSFDTLPDLLDHGFDALIDVRSPAEYAEDHIPGAINLPSLSNSERAEVGTIYKQVSPFKARKIGASLVLRNVADHIAGPLAQYAGAWRPLVYCWRGGQRSGVFSTLLGEVGWRADTILGGYRSFRRLVQTYLYEGTVPHRLILLDGNTGTAKTELLAQLQARGAQVIDLEGLARHRGSLLGARPGGQPSQRGFESALASTLSRLDPALPTLVEAESSKIGQINLPPALWSSMANAPRIEVSAPMQARRAYIAKAYQEVLSDPATVRKTLTPLRRVRGHATVDRWQALQDAKEYGALAEALMTDHYDPAYSKSRRSVPRDIMAQIEIASLDPSGLETASASILAAMDRASH